MSEKDRLYANIEVVIVSGIVIALTLLSKIPLIFSLYLFVGCVIFLVEKASMKKFSYYPFLVTIFVVSYPLLFIGVVIIRSIVFFQKRK